MDFALTAGQQAIVDGVRALCAGFDLDYWRRRDAEGGCPHDVYAKVARAGYLGIAMPVAHGGAGLGITEAVLVMQAIAESGAGLYGASAVHMTIIGLAAVARGARPGLALPSRPRPGPRRPAPPAPAARGAAPRARPPPPGPRRRAARPRARPPPAPPPPPGPPGPPRPWVGLCFVDYAACIRVRGTSYPSLLLDQNMLLAK